MQNMPILSRKGVRILKPYEYELLLRWMPRPSVLQFNGLLFTGMRYIEAVRFQGHPEWFDGKNYIMLPVGSMLKKKSEFQERTITLNNIGSAHVKRFLHSAPPLPSTQGWGQNLKKWAILAGLNPGMLCAKTTRKTWESWLANTYRDQLSYISSSQGHQESTSLKHYIGVGFYESDRKAMLKYVGGWKW